MIVNWICLSDRLVVECFRPLCVFLPPYRPVCLVRPFAPQNRPKGGNSARFEIHCMNGSSANRLHGHIRFLYAEIHNLFHFGQDGQAARTPRFMWCHYCSFCAAEEVTALTYAGFSLRKMFPVWICRDPIVSDSRDPMIIFSDSRDPNRVP